MIDSATHQPIHVATDELAGSYIMLPLDQLATVRKILDANRIQYWVDRHAISVDGRPAMAFINLGRKTDPLLVQGFLDAAA
jgi:hypothetical protein